MAETWKPPPHGSPVWIEIPTTGDVRELKDFYSKLFQSWTWRASDGDMDPEKDAHFSTPEGLGGGVVKAPPGSSTQTQTMGSGMTVYYIVPNLEEAEAKVHELGGKSCVKKTPAGPHAYYMNFYDPEGNRFGVYQFGA